MWIHDFLRNRKQQVVVGHNKSPETNVTAGVPQSSVLSPTSFLVYINDLPQRVNCKVSLFADNTLLYQTVNTDYDKSIFQFNITSMSDRATTRCMSLNAAKCTVMCFNEKLTSPIKDYTLSGTKLGCTHENKYLGVVI